jgi:hypothetical protein
MKKLLFSLVILSITLFSCENNDDDNNNGQQTIGNNVVIIENDIEEFTTWSGDSIYIIRAWDFYVSNTLKIEAGAIIKFHPSDGPYLMLGSSGTIVAEGTADNPIIFTSYKDDEHGGDQNGDGDATSPAPKDWGHINTNSYNGSKFEYCEFYYGGSSTYNATLTLYGDNITVKNCKFINNDGSYTSGAGDVGVLDASDAGTGTVIQNNVFYNNKRPLSISTAFDIDNSNIFHNPDYPSQINQYNGIFVETINGIEAPRSWAETEIPFVIHDNQFIIKTDNSLTLANDVVLKFKSGSVLQLDDGLSSISNYNGTSVYFTSYKDDSKKGDTNGDGSTTSPANNDWTGIYNNSTSDYEAWPNILYDAN